MNAQPPAVPKQAAGRPEAGVGWLRARNIAIGLIIPLTILLFWQLASQRGWVSPIFLPLPSTTLFSFFDMVNRQSFHIDFLASISIVTQSFIYGSVLGIGLGIAAGLSQTVERIFGPTLDGIRHIPGIAWLPLIVLWVGIGPAAKIVVITKTVFFPVFLNTLQGIRGVEKNYIELAKVLTLTRWQLVRKVILPSAMPSILVGVRYGASLAWALVVVAEGLSGMEGVGYLIFRAQSLLMTDQLLVCMVVIGVVGFLIDRSMALLQRHLLRWKQGFDG
ncbi:ABC transporter permease [Mesorhizobium sp. DCY119]|uniref:ABC transporter permease n=1 Tax=Mesorhizobium sp. DCY119 TaxID=2108445 RepID=UPI001FE1C8DC|nr:ABC transporter permease [Mesorhizobium sp. DCY119]